MADSKIPQMRPFVYASYPSNWNTLLEDCEPRTLIISVINSLNAIGAPSDSSAYNYGILITLRGVNTSWSSFQMYLPNTSNQSACYIRTGVGAKWIKITGTSISPKTST